MAFIHFAGYYSAIQKAIIYYVVDHPKVGEGHIWKKLPICNTFTDKRHLLILVAITLPSKKLQFCYLCNNFKDERYLLNLVGITELCKEAERATVLQLCYVVDNTKVGE